MDNNFLLLNLKEIVLQCTTEDDYDDLYRRIDYCLFLDLSYHERSMFLSFLITQGLLVYEVSGELLLEPFTMRVVKCWRKQPYNNGNLNYMVHEIEGKVLKHEDVTRFVLKLAQYNIIPVAYSIEFFDDVVKGFIQI